VLLMAYGARQLWSAPVLHALRAWRRWSPLLLLGAWTLHWWMPLAEHLILLGLVSAYAAGLGWLRQQHRWLCAACILAVLQLHGWWLVWTPRPAVVLLLPWYTVQLATLTWLVLWAERRLQGLLEARAHGAVLTGWLHTAPLQPLALALAWLWPWLTGATLVMWGLHGVYVLATLHTSSTLFWLLGRTEGLLAALAMLCWMLAVVRQAQRSGQEWWIYMVALVGATVWAYVRVYLVGLAPMHVWDTVALLGASYGLFILQRFIPLRALWHVAMVLPLLVLVTVPWQYASLHTTVTLITVAGLYLGMRHRSGQAMPLYLGLLTLNIGVYLWIPAWAQSYGVLQLYTIPAALSVLWLLQAHQHELRPQVLHGCRLAASSVLYVSTTMDVFLRADISIFLAALGLSLAGIVLGIALRTRAFLYAGLSFFVLNIVGQLIMLFPEQRLTRALILLALGTLITGGMIWFNLQREAMLQRLRLLRADLATWA